MVMVEDTAIEIGSMISVKTMGSQNDNGQVATINYKRQETRLVHLL